MTSEDSLCAYACCDTDRVADTGDDNDDDTDGDNASGLLTDASATQHCEVVSSVKTERASPVDSCVSLQTSAVAGPSGSDAAAAAVNKRQLWIVVQRQLSPAAVTTSGNCTALCVNVVPSQ